MKEIAEMKLLIADIDRNGRRADRPLPAGPAVLMPSGKEEARKSESGELIESDPL